MKVGDAVKVVTGKPSCGWGEVKCGDIGVIAKIMEPYNAFDTTTVYVDFEGIQNGWQCEERELKLLSYSSNQLATSLLETSHPFDEPIEVSADYEDVGLPF